MARRLGIRTPLEAFPAWPRQELSALGSSSTAAYGAVANAESGNAPTTNPPPHDATPAAA